MTDRQELPTGVYNTRVRIGEFDARSGSITPYPHVAMYESVEDPPSHCPIGEGARDVH